MAGELRERPPAADRVPAGGRPADRPLTPAPPEPFEVLFDRECKPAYALTEGLEAVYGRLGFAGQTLYSNFVSSLDGIATLGSNPSAGSLISGRNPADRFLMALLRACADAVLIGAGTLRATPGHRWSAEHVFPALAEEFAELRRMHRLAPQPRLVVLTASGDIDPSHPAIAEGATIATTRVGAQALRGRLSAASDVIESPGPNAIEMAHVAATLRDRGYGAILTEGGPHVMGELVKADLLDEAFLTLSPVLAGEGDERRSGMVAGVELLPDRGRWTRLESARRHGDLLFLRYSLRPA